MDDNITTGNNQTTGDDNSVSMAQDTTSNQDSDTQEVESTAIEDSETPDEGVEQPEIEGEEQQPEEKLPFHKDPYVKNLKRELAETKAQLEALEKNSTQNLEEKSSLETTDNTDPFTAHPLLQGIQLPEFKEMKVDSETGEVIEQGYESYGEFSKDFMKAVADALPTMIDNLVKVQEQNNDKAQAAFERSVQVIREDIGSEEAANEFLTWYKGKSDKGMNLSLDQAYPIFKEDIYQPKKANNQANKDTASKVARSNNSLAGSGIASIRNTSLSDVVKRALK